MEKMILSILCVNRPKHLYVTLDSIFRMDMINKCDVHLMMLYTNQEMMREQFHFISHFPIKDIHVLYDPLSCYWNHLSQFNLLSKMDYEWFLIVEDDIMLRKDALVELFNVEKHAFCYCLYNYDALDGDLRWIYRQALGNVFASLYNKSSLTILTNWLNANMAMGLSWTEDNTPMYKADPQYYIWGNDVKLTSLFAHNKLIEAVPSQSLCLHFGLNTAIEESLRTQVEAEMFAGTKEQWLDNILSVLSKYKSESQIAKILRPYHFEYR